MIEALIFDFDGLVVDTEGPSYASWKYLFSSYGMDLSFDHWVSTVGSSDAEFDPYAELERLTGKVIDWKMVDAERRRIEFSLIDREPIRPGVLQYLQGARRLGLKIGMASSSSCDWVQGHLTRLGISDYFEVIRGKDDVHRTKPSPELYQTVLEAFGLQGEQAIVLEDSLNGVLAARQANCFTVAVPNDLTRHLAFEPADLVLNSLQDMTLEQLIKIAEGRAVELSIPDSHDEPTRFPPE
jgi:HAD superfamily hydrolase (TIGR01509 family)